MAEKRNIPTAVLISLTTTVRLADAGEIHTAAEFILGHEVWVHHFACDEFWSKIRAVILKQHPDLTPDLADDVNRDNVWVKRDALIKRFGETREVVKGNYEPELNFIEGIPEGKKLILFEVSKKS